jgi:pentose-5-phosphate-3-epimerase
MNRGIFLLLLCLVPGFSATSQQISYTSIKDKLDTSYHAKKVTDLIKIDGNIAEQTWKNAQKTV